MSPTTRRTTRRAAGRANHLLASMDDGKTNGGGTKRKSSVELEKPAQQPKREKTDPEGEDSEEGDSEGDGLARESEPATTENAVSCKDEQSSESEIPSLPETIDNEVKGEEDKEGSGMLKPANEHYNGEGDIPKPNPDENTTQDGTAVKLSPKREATVSSGILEKGIIYFFYRARVGVDEPESIEDVARSFIVLRAMPLGATLVDGPIGDDKNCRLLSIPKKVLPRSKRDRFMGFVEKTETGIDILRDTFLASSEYETQTMGTRKKPPATPVAEGVYAITSTAHSSHLAYILTIPSVLDEVQTGFGLRDRGSFVMSSKNPNYPGPSNARLPQVPEYPQRIPDVFDDLRWVPLEPEFIDYHNAQFLLIGEAQGEFGGAVSTAEKDEKFDKDAPETEIETLEHENEVRVDHLGGDHAVFDDLGLYAKDYPGIKTAWSDQSSNSGRQTKFD